MLYVQYPAWLKPEVISGLPIRWYGLMYLFAFATCYIFTVTQLKKNKTLQTYIPYISNVFFWSIIGAIIGARIASEVVYSRNILILLTPWKMFWPFDSNMNFVGIQGMSYHGGLIGVIITYIAYCKIVKISAWRLGDIICIGASLGYGFGRLGNFINGELYGRITTSKLGIIFPRAELLPYGDSRVKEVADALNIEPNSFGMVNLPRHPSQLYELFLESIVTFIVLFSLYKIITSKKLPYMYGMFLPLYILCYSIARFIVEYFRQPDEGLDFVIKLSSVPNPRWLFVTLWNFTTGQVFSFILIVISISILLIMRLCHKSKKTIPVN